MKDNTQSQENGDESTAANGADAENHVETTAAKKAKKSVTAKKVKKCPVTGSPITVGEANALLREHKIKITKFRGNTLRDRIKIGGILKHAQKKLANREGGQKYYKAWVKDVLRMSSTDETNARRLDKLFTGTFKTELGKLDGGYRNALNYSIVELALFAWENLLKPSNETSSKKGTNLESLDFLPDAIVLKFKGSDDEHDLSKMSVRVLKKLLDPSTKTPQKKVPRQSVSVLQDLLKLAREDNEALRQQLKVLTEKIMLFQGGVSAGAETETASDVIPPTESTSDGGRIDALLEKMADSFPDAAPDTMVTKIDPDGDQPDGGNPDGQQPDGEQPGGAPPHGQQPDGEPGGEPPLGQQPDGEQPDGNAPGGDAGANGKANDEIYPGFSRKKLPQPRYASLPATEGGAAR